MFTHSKPPRYTPISWISSLPTTAGSVSRGGRLTVCVKAVPGLPPCPPGTGSSRICPRPGQHYRIYWNSACRPRSPPQCGLCSLCNRQNNFTLNYPLRNKHVSLTKNTGSDTADVITPIICNLLVIHGMSYFSIFLYLPITLYSLLVTLCTIRFNVQRF